MRCCWCAAAAAAARVAVIGGGGVASVVRYDLPSHYQTLKMQDGASVDSDTLGFMMETMAGFCQDTLGPLNEVGDKVGSA